eukprot:m.262096 g.262096  ORF g.262096 m.262096 type:complete len:81 (-) comp47549_c0_seq1:36-278(-)
MISNYFSHSSCLTSRSRYKETDVHRQSHSPFFFDIRALTISLSFLIIGDLSSSLSCSLTISVSSFISTDRLSLCSLSSTC